jgi:hypothetical protein
MEVVECKGLAMEGKQAVVADVLPFSVEEPQLQMTL